MSFESPSSRKPGLAAKIMLAASLTAGGGSVEASPVKQKTTVSAEQAKADRFILNAHNDRGLQREGVAVHEQRLSRYQNAEEIREAVRRGELVRVPDSGFGFRLDPGLGHLDQTNWQMYRHAQPKTLEAIEDIGQKFRQQFHRDFIVTSLVRSCEYQAHLQKGNQNAVSCADTSHISGTTFDARYSSMRPEERIWFEHQLAELERQGRIQATKEVGPSQCYHAMVFPRPVGYEAPNFMVARK